MKHGKFVLAVLALVLAVACAPVTGSIGVHETQGKNWIIFVDGLTASTVAANSSMVIDKVKPGVHEVGGGSGPWSVPYQWVTVEAGQTVWVNF